MSEALHDAVKQRWPKRGELLHHSDRGCQYTSEDYQKTLKTLGIECSMSRRGNCYGNAVAERFFWSLKREWRRSTIHADATKRSATSHPTNSRPITPRHKRRKPKPRRCPKVLGYRKLIPFLRRLSLLSR